LVRREWWDEIAIAVLRNSEDEKTFELRIGGHQYVSGRYQKVFFPVGPRIFLNFGKLIDKLEEVKWREEKNHRELISSSLAGSTFVAPINFYAPFWADVIMRYKSDKAIRGIPVGQPITRFADAIPIIWQLILACVT
jgi:hypothetical protein